jgi:hypothetical protein
VKIFISWSGDRSRAIAEELRDWLPTIVQSLEPFISTQDVPAGARGLNVLASQLQDCSFGIICLTQENKQGQWINFEAGALSKVIDASRVVPLLLDLKISDLTGPLTQFQAVSIEDRDGVFALLKALAEQTSPPIPERNLERLFDAFWPQLEEKVSQLKVAATSEPKKDARSEREILEEILLLSRNTERQMSSAIITRAKSGAPSSTGTFSLGPSIRMFQLTWDEIVNAVKGYSRVAWMLLRNAVPTNLAKDVLTVEFAREGDVTAFLRSNHEKALEDAILDFTGVRLRIAAVTQSSASPSTDPAEDTKLTEMDLIQRELGGQVVGEFEG